MILASILDISVHSKIDASGMGCAPNNGKGYWIYTLSC